MLGEVKLALDFFWKRNINLLLCSTSLFITNSVCIYVSNYPTTLDLSNLACSLYFITQILALSIFMERKNIWSTRKGNSIIWKILYES
mmetsp:Transcript_35661/g.45973  ORF Transcript_35661/g.45973 Transcript_35661/m.45973 type:complete len:88 (+) Transcript_35661:1242-1505(+)